MKHGVPLSFNSCDARLRLLWGDEPLSSVKPVQDFATIRYTPKPAPLDFWRVVLGCTPLQQFLLKLCLRMDLNPSEHTFLRSLHERGRYRSDPDPQVVVMCLGRRFGKTSILVRLAELLRGSNSVFAHSEAARRQFNSYGPSSMLWNGFGLNSIPVSHTVLFDECQLMNGWSDAISYLQIPSIATFSYQGLPLEIPGNLRVMAISLGDLAELPEDPMLTWVRDSWTDENYQEHFPPPLLNTVSHLFSTVGEGDS